MPDIRLPGQQIQVVPDWMVQRMRNGSIVSQYIQPPLVQYKSGVPTVQINKDLPGRIYDGNQPELLQGDTIEVQASRTVYQKIACLRADRMEEIDVGQYWTSHMRYAAQFFSRKCDETYLQDIFQNIDFEDEFAKHTIPWNTRPGYMAEADVIGINFQHIQNAESMLQEDNVNIDVASRCICLMPLAARDLLSTDDHFDYSRTGVPLAQKNPGYIAERLSINFAFMPNKYFMDAGFYSEDIDGAGHPGYYGFYYPVEATLLTLAQNASIDTMQGVIHNMKMYETTNATDLTVMEALAGFGGTIVHPESVIRIAFRIAKG